jgi:malonyl-CoA O-methyltransferase
VSWNTKRQIARQFSRSAARYGDFDEVQRQAAGQLLGHLPALLTPPELVLDLGCGTGSLLRQLMDRYPASQGIGLDLAPGMVSTARKHTPPDALQFIQADIEQLPLATASIHLVASSAALQWVDIDRAATEIHRVLHPRGTAILGIFVEGTLASWQPAFQGSAFAASHPLPSVDRVEQALTGAGLRIISRSITELTQHHPSALEMLASVKRVGATYAGARSGRGLIGRQAWADLLDRLDGQFATSGYQSHYRLLCLRADHGQP